jgi:hypothetical protein
MAVAQFTFVTLPNPTEAALKWVETARKGSKAWTDGWLQIIATFSEAAQTQAKVLKSLTPSMAVPTMAPVEALPAPVEMLAEPVEAMAKVVEAAPALVEAVPAVVEAPPALVEVTPAPMVEAKVETPPAPVAKAEVEPALAAQLARAPVAKVRVEPLTAPSPVFKAPVAAKPVAKAVKPAARKKT